MYSFLLKPRWIGFLIVGLILAVLFTSLGFWQLRRLEHRRANNDLLTSRFSESPQPLIDLITNYRADVSQFDDTSIAYRPTVVTGRYDTSSEVLLRTTDNYEGQPGFYILTPLVLEDNQADSTSSRRAVLVMRGWVPFELNTPPVKEATPPIEDITVEGMVYPETKRPSGFLSSLTPRDPPGKLKVTAYTDSTRLEEQMPYDLLPVYIRLESQTPPHTNTLPLKPEGLELSEGSHLGYAVQWFAFTVIGVTGYVLLIRRTAIEQREESKMQKAKA
jgi:surfeit locus 1 family protein